MSTKDLQHIHSSKSTDWFTPAYVIEPVREWLGGYIDLDPASNETANQMVKAGHIYTEKENGLNQNWCQDFSTFDHKQTVFCNPPYGKERGRSRQDIWAQKMIWEFKLGHFQKGVLLVNACFGDKWFIPLLDFPILLPYRRIEFYGPNGVDDGPPKGNALVLFNRDYEWEGKPSYMLEEWREHFKDLGVIGVFGRTDLDL